MEACCWQFHKPIIVIGYWTIGWSRSVLCFSISYFSFSKLLSLASDVLFYWSLPLQPCIWRALQENVTYCVDIFLAQVYDLVIKICCCRSSSWHILEHLEILLTTWCKSVIEWWLYKMYKKKCTCTFTCQYSKHFFVVLLQKTVWNFKNLIWATAVKFLYKMPLLRWWNFGSKCT